MRFEICARQALGTRERAVQQDFWTVTDGAGASLDTDARQGKAIANDRALVVVADGVGGAQSPHSDVASQVASTAFVAAFHDADGTVEERLSGALTRAHEAVLAESGTDASLQGMATTLLGVFLQADAMSFVSVGDSPILRLRDDEIHLVNLKHVASEKFDREALRQNTPEAWAKCYASAGKRRSITLALGIQLHDPDSGHVPQFAKRALLPGDTLIVSSDGLETLTSEQIQNIARLYADRDVAALADALMAAVLGTADALQWRQDNTTFVVVRAVDEVTRILMPARTAEPAPAPPPAAPAARPAAQSAPPSARVAPAPAKARRSGWSSVALALSFAVLLLAVGVAAAYLALFPPESGRSGAARPAAAPVPAAGLSRTDPNSLQTGEFAKGQALQDASSPQGAPPSPERAPASGSSHPAASSAHPSGMGYSPSH